MLYNMFHVSNISSGRYNFAFFKMSTNLSKNTSFTSLIYTAAFSEGTMSSSITFEKFSYDALCK